MAGTRYFLAIWAVVQITAGDELSSADLPLEHRGFSDGPGFGGPQFGGAPPFGGGGNPTPFGGNPTPFGGGPPPFGGNSLGPEAGYSGPTAPTEGDPWQLPAPDLPKIRNIEVQCEKSSMRVSVDFDRPFYGMIFSKGHYSDQTCVHMQAGSGSLNTQFEIYLNSCGMTASEGGNYGQPNPAGSFVENTIIIQYDPLVQEVWDQARKLRCTWYDYYEKKVTFKPFQVDTLNAVTANFLGDNLQCWMQIQVGKGPWASEVSGIVKIGQTMTMVLAIKDDENKFDMLVRNCVAHDGNRAPIQLVDENGCVTRPKVMSKFQKIKNFGSSASVVSYAYFQAFKFPDSMNVHFQCVIQVCRYQCPEPTCGGPTSGPVYDVSPRNPELDYQAAGSETNEVVAGEKTKSAVNSPPRRRHPGVNHREGIPAGAVKRRPGPVIATRPVPQPAGIAGKPSRLHLPSAGRRRPHPGYASVNRNGVALAEGQYAISGQPRSIDDEDLDRMSLEAAAKDMLEAEEEESSSRRRRHAVYRRDAQEMTDVSTERIIQVVAPGDVAFNLNANNETVVVSQSLADIERAKSSICMSVPGFVAGLIMLLLVLVIACIVSVFLFTRVRAVSAKSSGVFATSVDCPEFVKCPN